MSDPVVLTSLDMVTHEWLTGVLTKSGALSKGHVIGFEADGQTHNYSTGHRIRIAYSADAQGTRPTRLFLKLVNADMGDELFGASEVDYYRRDYAGVIRAPIILCYDAAYSEKLLRYHLLLDDLTEGHIEAKHRTPTLGYGFALAEGLACLHAHWWGAKRIVESGDRIPSEDQIFRFVEVARPGADPIVRDFRGELQAHWPGAMDELFARHPQAMVDRTRNGNGFALIHGDVNRTNILVPREADRPLYLIDRQPFDWSLVVWLGVYDLAYAMVLDWDVELRRRLEMPVLRRYFDTLLERGIQGYPWEQLFDDYRLSAAMCVYVATEWCSGGINHEWKHIWWPKLLRSLTVCDDLNCRELWT